MQITGTERSRLRDRKMEECKTKGECTIEKMRRNEMLMCVDIYKCTYSYKHTCMYVYTVAVNLAQISLNH